MKYDIVGSFKQPMSMLYAMLYAVYLLWMPGNTGSYWIENGAALKEK